MTIENNTNCEHGATLTESQLFAEFYSSTVSSYDTRGKERYTHHVDDLLQPFFDNCEIDFRIIPDEVEDPSSHLELLEGDLHGALANLQFVRKAWDDFKSERLIDEDSSTERFTVAGGAK